MRKVLNVIFAGVIVVLSITIALLWILSGFPFRYWSYIGFFPVIFDTTNIIYFIMLFKISNKTKFVILIFAVMLLVIGFYASSFIDPIGDCMELGGTWHSEQGCTYSD